MRWRDHPDRDRSTAGPGFPERFDESPDAFDEHLSERAEGAALQGEYRDLMADIREFNRQRSEPRVLARQFQSVPGQDREEAPGLDQTAAKSNGRGRHGQAGRSEPGGAECIRDEGSKEI